MRAGRTIAREAAVRDVRVISVSDATAPIGDVTADETRKVSCATIGLLFGHVLPTGKSAKPT